VLILGGGSGNDATIALANQAERVDVVEIDPVIAEMGYDLHPNRPYSDARVRVIVDDARAFLRRNREKYDLVVMNALDSHLQIPGLSTLRLESYVYTREAFADVQQSLAPDALFVVHLSSTRPWMGERLYWSLTAAFNDRPPKLFTTSDSPYESLAFVYGPAAVLDRGSLREQGLLAVDPQRFQLVREQTVLATDDWPQLYLSGKSIPAPYLIVLAAMLVVVWLSFRLIGPIDLRGNLSLFLLGAAFMLLETRSLTKTALLFGSTWFVNAIVIASILAVLSLGNYCVLRGRHLPLRVAFPLLGVVLVAQAFLREDWMLGVSLPVRLTLVAIWIGAPILLAGFVFSQMFRAAERTAQAFGANLLGAGLGGALEYLSMMYGLSSLFLVAAGLYFLAALTGGAFARRPGTVAPAA